MKKKFQCYIKPKDETKERETQKIISSKISILCIAVVFFIQTGFNIYAAPLFMTTTDIKLDEQQEFKDIESRLKGVTNIEAVTDTALNVEVCIEANEIQGNSGIRHISVYYEYMQNSNSSLPPYLSKDSNNNSFFPIKMKKINLSRNEYNFETLGDGMVKFAARTTNGSFFIDENNEKLEVEISKYKPFYKSTALSENVISQTDCTETRFADTGVTNVFESPNESILSNVKFNKMVFDISQRGSNSVMDGFCLEGIIKDGNIIRNGKSVEFPVVADIPASEEDTIVIPMIFNIDKLECNPYNNKKMNDFLVNSVNLTNNTPYNPVKWNPDDAFIFNFPIDVKNAAFYSQQAEANIVIVLEDTEGNKHYKRFHFISKPYQASTVIDYTDMVYVTEDYGTPENNVVVPVFSSVAKNIIVLNGTGATYNLENLSEAEEESLAGRNIINVKVGTQEAKSLHYDPLIYNTTSIPGIPLFTTLESSMEPEIARDTLRFKAGTLWTDATTSSSKIDTYISAVKILSTTYSGIDASTNAGISLTLGPDEKYRITEYTIDYIVNNVEATRRSAKLLLVVIRKNTLLTPVLDTYIPLYFKKNGLKPLTSESGIMVNEPDSKKYYYYGSKKGLVATGLYNAFQNMQNKLSENNLSFNLADSVSDSAISVLYNFSKTHKYRLTPNYLGEYGVATAYSDKIIEPKLIDFNDRYKSSGRLFLFSSIADTDETFNFVNNSICFDKRTTQNDVYTLVDRKKLDEEENVTELEIGFNKLQGVNDTLIPTIQYNLNISENSSDYTSLENYMNCMENKTAINEYITNENNGKVEKRFEFDNIGVFGREEHSLNDGEETFRYRIPKKMSNTNYGTIAKIPLYLKLNWKIDGNQRVITLGAGSDFKFAAGSPSPIERNNSSNSTIRTVDIGFNFTPYYHMTYQEDKKIKLFKNEKSIPGSFDVQCFVPDQGINSEISEGMYIKDLYDGQDFSTTTSAINPDFYSRLGDSYKLKPFLVDSSIKNGDSINKFFALRNGQVINIDYYKGSVELNMDKESGLDVPGEKQNYDYDSRFILAGNNRELFTYFRIEENNNTNSGSNELKIVTQGGIDVTLTRFNDYSVNYLYDNPHNDKKEPYNVDSIELDRNLFTDGKGEYLKNEGFYDKDLKKRWLEIKENPGIYGSYRLSKRIVPETASATIGEYYHLKDITDFYGTESIVVSLGGFGDRNYKTLSCDYTTNGKNPESMKDLKKYDYKAQIGQLLPNIKNIFLVTSDHVAEITEGTNRISDVDPDSFVEIAAHGRLYGDSTVNLCLESRFDYMHKVDYFNLKNIGEYSSDLQNIPQEKYKFFGDMEFNENDKNSIINSEVQSLYEKMSRDQDKKSFFYENSINKRDNSSNLMESVVIEDNNCPDIMKELGYNSNDKIKLPFNILYFNKLALKYKDYTISSEFTNLSELNEIDRPSNRQSIVIFDSKGKIYLVNNYSTGAQPNFELTDVTAVTNSGIPLPVSYSGRGDFNNNRITLNNGIILNVSKIMILVSTENEPRNFIKYTPVYYKLEMNNYYFDKANEGKMAVESRRGYLNREDAPTLFKYLNTDSKEKVEWLPKEKKQDMFYNFVAGYRKDGSGDPDRSSEEVISNDLYKDMFKLFPTENYSFMVSGNNFITEIPDEFKNNQFTRSLVAGKMNIDIVPQEAVNLGTAANPSAGILYKDMSSNEELKSSLESTIFLNNNNYVKNIDTSHGKPFYISDKNGVYILPELRTKINMKEKLILRDKSDLGAEVDYREDMYTSENLGDEMKDIILNKSEKNMGTIKRESINYLQYEYKMSERVSNFKEMRNGKIVETERGMTLYKEEPHEYNYKQEELKEINPDIFIEEIKIYRQKINEQGEELLLTIHLNEAGNNSVSSVRNNEIYLKNSDGTLKNDSEIVDVLKGLPYFKAGFDRVETKRVVSGERRFFHGLTIKGLTIGSEFFGKYLRVEAKTRLQLGETAKYNKGYEIEGRNSKRGDIVVKDYRN